MAHISNDKPIKLKTKCLWLHGAKINITVCYFRLTEVMEKRACVLWV
jgi:hypothetical protein